MPLVDVTLVKKHLRIDWADEDAEIDAYHAAAEAIVVEYLDRVVLAEEPLPVGDTTAILVTPPIVAAVLLVTADLFESRDSGEGEGEAILPPAVRRLLAPYRGWRQFEVTDALVPLHS